MSSTSNESIVHLLRTCEESGLAPGYKVDTVGCGCRGFCDRCDDTGCRTIVDVDSGGREVIVISDLHMASGLDEDDRYAGTENFFSDGPFARFVDKKNIECADTGGLLIINGDFIDFLRVVDVPSPGKECEAWSNKLAEIGVHFTGEELAKKINNKQEKTFGLKTHDYRSVWRLLRSIEGHYEFFLALARWLSRGNNQLIVLKGNHDLEWYWREVRNMLRLEIGQIIVKETGRDLEAVLKENVLPHIRFVDDAMTVDGDVYVEHGHRYDKFTLVLGSPAEVYNKATGDIELNIPFGSFFNRYILNKLEIAYPYVDNVRPTGNLLPMLIRENFPLAVKMMFVYSRYLIQILRKNPRYLKFMFAPLVSMLVSFALPVLILSVVVALNWDHLYPLIDNPSDVSSSLWDTLLKLLGTGAQSVGGLILSYFLAKVVAQLQLSEPSSLNDKGREILTKYDYRIVTMGHTHNPDQFQVDGKWFYNTGTWIPILETTSSEVRRDRMFCVLHLRRDPSTNELAPHPLEHWNDSAGRCEPWILVKPH